MLYLKDHVLEGERTTETEQDHQLVSLFNFLSFPEHWLSSVCPGEWVVAGAVLGKDWIRIPVQV